jgi:hypothetical protein
MERANPPQGGLCLSGIMWGIIASQKGSPMKVKSLEKSTSAYALNSLKAYLEGEQNLKWITSIIGSGAPAREMLAGLSGYGNPERYHEFSAWLSSAGF